MNTRRIFLALLMALALQACGGGDEDDPDNDTGPIDCKARPELCK